jgi:hypothetical protein
MATRQPVLPRMPFALVTIAFCQRLSMAPRHLKQRPRNLVCEPYVLGLKLRYRRITRILPYHWEIFVPEGGYPSLILPPLPWSFEHQGHIPSPPMAGNVRFVASLARCHLDPGPKLQYLLQSIVNGFSTLGRWLQLTPGLRRLSANRISPGMSGSDAVDAQIDRILARNQGLITTAPIPGTQNFIINVDDTKTNADGTIKYRPVSSCSYPCNDTCDRTSWTAHSDTTVYSEALLLAMAAVDRLRMRLGQELRMD